MLFDTSSPSRKRAVQVIFATLALLMGGGLVLFGIGSNTGDGGLADALGGGGVSIDDTAKKDRDSATKALAANPRDEAAAVKLAKANILIATQSGLDANGQVVEDGGAALVSAADTSWTKYLALGPTKPDAGVAIQYSNFYAYPGVSKYDKAARALEAALVTRKPNSGLYAQLAIYALASGNNEKYKEARAEALELAPDKTRRDAIADQLDEIQKSIEDQQKAASEAAEASGDSAGATSTTPPLKTLPGLGGIGQ